MERIGTGTPIAYYASHDEAPQPGQIQQWYGDTARADIVAWSPLYMNYRECEGVPRGVKAIGPFWLLAGERP